MKDVREKYPQYSDLSDQDLAISLHKKFYSDMPGAEFFQKIGLKDKADPTTGTGAVQRFFEGAGRGMAEVGRGIKQLSTMGPTNEEGRQRQQQVQGEVDEARKLDAPLMATTAGKVGNVVGQVAASAPAAAIPGANTLVGGALVGAGLGAAQPTATGESRGQNALMGAAGGAAGQALGSVAAKGLGAMVGRATPTGAATAETRFLDEGLKIPPSMSKGKPGFVAKELEGFSGKIKTEQAASAANAPKLTDLARRSIDLPPQGELSHGEVISQRQAYGQSYDAVKKFKGQFTETPKFIKALDSIKQRSTKSRRQVLKNQQVSALVKDLRGNYSPDEAVEVVKKLRADASLNARSLDPNVRGLARAQKRAAQAVDDLIEEHLSSSGQQDIYLQYLKGRVGVAKTYDVEKALNTSTRQISPPKIAKLDAAKPGRLTGDLKTIADFAKSYEGAARDISQRGSRAGPSRSPLDYAAATLAGVHHPIAGAAMLARPMARKYVLSDMAQQGLRGIPPTLEQQTLPRAGELIGSQAVQRQQQ
jgi:hypothetical protein